VVAHLLFTHPADEFFSSHPDRLFAVHEYCGLSSGFHIGKSVAYDQCTGYKIRTGGGQLVGPLVEAILPSVHTSLIGLVPNGYLSVPANDVISQELASLTYTKVDDEITTILQLGSLISRVHIALSLSTLKDTPTLTGHCLLGSGQHQRSFTQ
jgi:hypothetical protein